MFVEEMQVPTKSAAALDLDAVNQQLAGADAGAIMAWAHGAFGAGLVMSSSFGAESAVTLHLVTQTLPQTPVILIDTGYLFPETYHFIEELTSKLKLNLKVYQAALSPARMEALYGRLWEQGLEGQNRYDQMRKVEPMRRALKDLHARAWAAGLRRAQTQHRATLRAVELQDGIYKVHPILAWTTRDVHQYLKTHGLPYHPLYEKGYKSIGDVQSTVPITAGMDERAGRFGGVKQECGLHLPGPTGADPGREPGAH